MSNEITIPKTTIKKILKANGAKSVSPKACVNLEKALLEHANKIAADSVWACKYNNRKTVRPEDVEMAVGRK